MLLLFNITDLKLSFCSAFTFPNEKEIQSLKISKTEIIIFPTIHSPHILLAPQPLKLEDAFYNKYLVLISMLYSHLFWFIKKYANRFNDSFSECAPSY